MESRLLSACKEGYVRVVREILLEGGVSANMSKQQVFNTALVRNDHDSSELIMMSFLRLINILFVAVR